MAEMPMAMSIKIDGGKPLRSRSTRSTSQHSDRSSSRGSSTSTGSRKAAKKIVIKGEVDEHEASYGRGVASAGTSTTVAQILRTYCPTYHHLPILTETSEAPPNFEDASFLEASETLLASKTAQVPVMFEPLPKHFVSHSVVLHSSGGTAAHVVGTTHGVLVYRPVAAAKVDGRSEQHTIADGKELELLSWALEETRDDPAYHDVELLCALPRIADAYCRGVLADGSKPPPRAHLNYFAFSSSKSPTVRNDRSSPGRGRVALGAPHEDPMWCVSASSISSQFLVSHSLHRTRRIVSVCMQSVFLPFSFAAANSSRSSHIPLVVSIDEEGGVCLLDVARETSCVVSSSVDDDSSKCLEDMFSSKSRSTTATPSSSDRIVDVVHASLWQSTPEKRKEMTSQDALPLFHFLGKGGKLLRIESVLIGPCTEACSECIEHSSKLLSEGWVPLYLILSLSMGSSSPHQVTEEARGSSVTGQQLQVIRVELSYFARGVTPRAVIASVEILESVSITPPATASRRGLAAIPSTVLAVSDLGRSFMDESLNLSASFFVAAPRQRLLCYRACTARVVASYALPTFGTGLGGEQHSSNCSSASCVYVSHLISVGELSLPKMGCAASSEDIRKFERCIVCETSSGVLLLASLPPMTGSSDLPALVDHPVIDARRDELQSADDYVARSEKAALDAWLDSVDSDNDELHAMESLASLPQTKPSIPRITKAFQAEIVFAAKPAEYGSPMHHQPGLNGGDVGTYASTSTVRKDMPLTVLRVLCYDEGAVAQYSRNPSRAVSLCNLAKSTTPRVVLLFTDAQACVVSLGPIMLAADTNPMSKDRVKESSASPTHEDPTVAVEWKTLKAQGTPGSLMHMLTSVAHNVQIPVVRTNVTSLSPSGHAPSGSRFFASLLFGSAPALSDVVPIVTPDPPAPQLVATPHVYSDHDSSSQSSRSSRRSSSGRTWRRSNKSVRQHLSSVEATISAYEVKAILEPIEISAPERIALDIFELMEKQKHQVEARDEPEFRNQIIHDEAARWLTLYTDLDGAYAKAAAKDARHRRTFVAVSPVVASASSYVDVFPLRSSAYEAENITTASARFMRLWRQRRTASTSRAASAVDQAPLRHQEWLAEYFLKAKQCEGGHSNDETLPFWLLALQDSDRCQFEVSDLECCHAAQLDSINETDDVVVAENQRAIRLEGGGVQWEPLPSCPFQYLAGGGHADIAALNAQGSTQRRGDGAWRWEKEASASQLSGRLDSSSAVLNGWTVRVDWRYATQWPTIEPGDDEHWSLAADDSGAMVRRRVLYRRRIDCQLEANKMQLRKRLDKEMAAFRAQYGLVN